MARAPLLALWLFAVLVLASCGDSSGPDVTAGAGAAVRGKITVFAAASLTDAFTEIAARFEEAHPGTEVEFNFGGSPTLRTQLDQGARADVFASADAAQMDLALKSRVVESTGSVFGGNSLVIITPASNPARLAAPADLARAGLKLVLAAPEVPAGSYARQMLVNLERDPAIGAGFSDRVLRNVVSNESNVKQVVAKVQLGEADAGIVYSSDVTPSVASALNVIAVPSQFNVNTQYPIAVTREASNQAAATAFIVFVLSDRGQQVLKKLGFSPPS